MKSVKINTNDSNQRIDNFLRKSFPKLTLNSIYKYIRMKRIKVNEKRTEEKYILKQGDTVQLYVNDEFLTKNESSKDFLLVPKKLDVVYEDQNIILINKPVGLVVHDDDNNTVDTLTRRLQHYLYDKKEWDFEKENSFVPALANRIDRNTSGIVIAAKNAQALRILAEKIKTREIDKYYLCHIHGIIDPKNGVLRDYLTKDEKKNKVLISKKPLNQGSSEIITEYKTLSHENNISLLEIHLITGKTHQIRAHMAFIGHPLVGESKYTDIRVKNGSHQDLISYKVTFNFKTNDGELGYLNHKTFALKPNSL